MGLCVMIRKHARHSFTQGSRRERYACHNGVRIILPGVQYPVEFFEKSAPSSNWQYAGTRLMTLARQTLRHVYLDQPFNDKFTTFDPYI